MATTDYDAPRPGSVEDPDTESLDAITTARKGAQSPNVDLDETDAADGIELPGADLSGEELTMPVIPKQADEFTCASCFLVQHRSRLASRTTLTTGPANRTAPSIHTGDRRVVGDGGRAGQGRAVLVVTRSGSPNPVGVPPVDDGAARPVPMARSRVPRRTSTRP